MVADVHVSNEVVGCSYRFFPDRHIYSFTYYYGLLVVRFTHGIDKEAPTLPSMAPLSGDLYGGRLLHLQAPRFTHLRPDPTENCASRQLVTDWAQEYLDSWVLQSTPTRYSNTVNHRAED